MLKLVGGKPHNWRNCVCVDCSNRRRYEETYAVLDKAINRQNVGGLPIMGYKPSLQYAADLKRSDWNHFE